MFRGQKKPPCPGQTSQVGGLQANGHGREGRKAHDFLRLVKSIEPARPFLREGGGARRTCSLILGFIGMEKQCSEVKNNRAREGRLQANRQGRDGRKTQDFLGLLREHG